MRRVRRLKKKKSKKRDALGAQRARIINFCSAFNNVFGAVSAAFAPIRDPSGKLIAMLGVSLSPAPYSTLNEIGSAMVAPFAVTVLLALMLAALLGRSVTRPLDSLRAQIELIGKGHLDAVEIPSKMSGEFRVMAAAIAAMAKGLRERDTIKRAFSGYISRQVLETIMEKGELPALKGERRRITVLFAYIRGLPPSLRT
jgi:methyl-accepting chemotaxis protein